MIITLDRSSKRPSSLFILLFFAPPCHHYLPCSFKHNKETLIESLLLKRHK
jgi:hypothetical protein